MWNAGLSFGKGDFRFYKSYDSWMSPFPEDDRQEFPELFSLPKGVIEISFANDRPLGIILDEIEAGKGVYVLDLVEGEQAELMGSVQKGDVVIGVTAIKVIGAKWERRLIPARDLDFDTVVGAIQSNQMKWGCEDVVMHFFRQEDVEDAEAVQCYLDFFNPPGDSPWRQQQ